MKELTSRQKTTYSLLTYSQVESKIDKVLSRNWSTKPNFKYNAKNWPTLVTNRYKSARLTDKDKKLKT